MEMTWILVQISAKLESMRLLYLPPPLVATVSIELDLKVDFPLRCSE